jgi:hypothetical protein
MGRACSKQEAHPSCRRRKEKKPLQAHCDRSKTPGGGKDEPEEQIGLAAGSYPDVNRLPS